jgi:hypothetical protein
MHGNCLGEHNRNKKQLRAMVILLCVEINHNQSGWDEKKNYQTLTNEINSRPRDFWLIECVVSNYLICKGTGRNVI